MIILKQFIKTPGFALQCFVLVTLTLLSRWSIMRLAKPSGWKRKWYGWIDWNLGAVSSWIYRLPSIYYRDEMVMLTEALYKTIKIKTVFILNRNPYHTQNSAKYEQHALFLVWIIDLLPGQNGRHFADDIFRCIFVSEKCCILIEISLKFVPKSPFKNNPALV